MPAILLYLICTGVLVLAWSRFVQRISLPIAFVLIVLPFCFTGRALLTARVYAPIDLPYASAPLKDYAGDYGITGIHNGWLSDLYKQMVPWRSAVREAITRGEWPLWNRFMLSGNILAGNMQSAPYDPLNLLALLLPEAQALTFGPAMTFFMAGFFTFLFLRLLGVGEIASTIGAATYMFNGALAFFVGWPLGRAWSLLPLVLIGAKLLVRECSVRSAVILTTGFVLVIVAGHPESVLHVVTIGAVYGLYELLVARFAEGATPRHLLRAVGLAVVCGIIALLLTAVTLLPFSSVAGETYEHFIRQSIRAVKELWTPPGAVVRRASASLYAFSGGQPQHGIHTASFDPTTMRVGSVALILALAALVLSKRRERWFFGGLAVVCAWIGLDAWPLAHLLHKVPLFDIALNDRLAFPATFAVAALAAFFADAWPVSRRGTLIAAAIAGITTALLLAGAVAIRVKQLVAGVPSEFILQMTIVSLGAAIVLGLLLVLRVTPRYALPLVLALLLLQRTVEDGSIYPALPASAFYPDVPILEHIQADQDKPFRIVGLGGALVPDTAALYGLEDARGYEAMTFLRLFESYLFWSEHQPISFNRIDDKSKPFLSALNIKYAIGSIDEEPDEQWKLVLEDRQTRLFENLRVSPRAFVPTRVSYAKDANGILQAMLSIEDFAEAAVITDPEVEPQEVSNGPGWLMMRRTGSLRYDIEAKMEREGWIVLSETGWPGWRAYVDGERVAIRYANHAFVGVFVPEGEHHVRLVYRPETFVRGRAISAITLVALLGYFGLRRYRLQKPRAV